MTTYLLLRATCGFSVQNLETGHTEYFDTPLLASRWAFAHGAMSVKWDFDIAQYEREEEAKCGC